MIFQIISFFLLGKGRILLMHKASQQNEVEESTMLEHWILIFYERTFEVNFSYFTSISKKTLGSLNNLSKQPYIALDYVASVTIDR
ncbi:hypothetical protein QQ008_19440 [Fulvivirgaceae bacterium BMA10]|uniref:Uncharacterized protein n=1 Tax=Splendidivirga corallicola TaxID=3051826 RepID=A0ABT8KS30_9BACT|nr:hypothetical protein [Fulvivirgaceae bacterium BMA10]